MQPLPAPKALMSIWEKQTWFRPADLLIVGGGLLGTWTAIEAKLKNPEWRIVIVEQYGIPLGASTRNAGFLCFGSPSELLSDIKTMGEKTAMKLVAMRWQGMQKIQKLFTYAEIGYTASGGFEGLSELQAQELLPQLQYLNALMEPITQQAQTFSDISDMQDCYGLKGFDVLLTNPFEGVLHSGKYMQTLQQKVQQMGVELFTGTQVQFYQKQHDVFNITTNRGVFTAKNIVYATNGALAKHFPQLGIQAARGQIVAIPSLNGLQLKGGFHAKEGYYYWRSQGNYILMGGGRQMAIAAENTNEINNTSLITSHLEDFLAQHVLPEMLDFNDVEKFAWAGTMAFTPNKLPLLSQVEPHVFAACCCNGMGVSLTPVFAETVVAHL